MPGGTPEQPQDDQLGLLGILAGFPHHPGLGGVQQGLAPLLQLTRPEGFPLLMGPSTQREAPSAWRLSCPKKAAALPSLVESLLKTAGQTLFHPPNRD